MRKKNTLWQVSFQNIALLCSGTVGNLLSLSETVSSPVFLNGSSPLESLRGLAEVQTVGPYPRVIDSLYFWQAPWMLNSQIQASTWTHSAMCTLHPDTDSPDTERELAVVSWACVRRPALTLPSLFPSSVVLGKLTHPFGPPYLHL